MQKRKTDGTNVSGTQLWLVLLKAFHAVSEFAADTIEESGLGDSDFRVLEALLHKGAMPVNAIGTKVFLTPGSISVAVDRLRKRGLVRRTESEDDRRVRVVDLTPEGRKLIARAFAMHAERMDELGQTLSAKERRAMTQGLKTLGKAAQYVSSPHRDRTLPAVASESDRSGPKATRK